ncbi:hypothetical protein PISL3812_08109 [Talaromyces islandicus]|uniref:Inheritance of peroxisomes protein 1 n=1 Tax=Talaromyces islandicus TaxID=28573 RepID=A0A0U1M7L7_TALIS|nr:hypothetical protein PISL3812_08109 [Talaromyces islandicus]
MSDGAPLPIRRSATLPTRLTQQKLQSGESPASRQASDGALFFHPSAKIVKFAPDAPPAAAQSTPSADFDYPVDTIETLPWRSPTERTVAVGRLRLEMVPGLTPFLKCGTVVHAILKNSQCWCVDGISTFVLRIRSLTYYRIELPNNLPEEEKLVEQFKEALPKVLRYEVTPCPFQRGFSVPLPAEAHAPKRKKKAWRPKGRRESAPAVSGVNNDWLGTSDAVDVSQRPRSAGTSDGEATDDSTSTTTTSAIPAETLPDDAEDSSSVGEAQDDKPGYVRRSMAEHPQSMHNILARFQPIPESDSENDENDEDDKLSSSGDSFHSLLTPNFESSPSPAFASPPESPLNTSFNTQDLHAPRQRAHGHTRDVSEVTITADTFSPATDTAPMPIQLTPNGTPTSKFTTPATPPPERSLPKVPDAFSTGIRRDFIHRDIRDRSTLTSRQPQPCKQRSLSPMPSPSTLISTPVESSESDLKASLFHKTCALVLVPPLQLLLLLIHIAAQIAAGHTVQTALEDTTKSDTDADAEDSDFEMPRTPGTFRRSLGSEDPTDALSDLE